jgi:tetratricopeptide (TPR) repeat protein
MASMTRKLSRQSLLISFHRNGDLWFLFCYLPFAMNDTTLTLDQALQQAVAHHRAGQLPEAEKLYRAILEAQPGHPDANHNLGVLAVNVNQPAAALPFFKTALEANPTQAQYWLSYIDALIRTGQADAARQVIAAARQRGLDGEPLHQLEKKLGAISQNPSLDSPPHTVAIAHREAGRYREAAAWLQDWLASQAQDAAAHALLGQVLLLDKQEEAAQVAIERAVALDAALPVVQRNLARLHLKQQKLEAALQAAQAAQQGNPANPESWLVLAAALGANKQDDKALPLVEQALQARPDYAEAFANRAILRLRANDLTAALADVEKALALKPHLGQLWAIAGSLRYQFKNLPGAIEALHKAREYEPENVSHMVNLGEYLRQDKQVEASLTLLEKATAIDPGNHGAWVNYGAALQEAERIDEAKAAYQKALDINPKSAEIANNLGALAKDAENWEDAAKFFGMAVDVKPDSAAIQCNLGVALKELDKIHEAAEHLQQAIQIDPNHAPAYVGLARMEIDQGEFAAAEVQIEKALQADPDSASAWALVPKLRKMAQADAGWIERARQLLDVEKSSQSRISLLYAMGKYSDDTKDYAAAFAYYQQANQLKKKINRAYDRQNHTNRINILTASHTREAVGKLRPGASASTQPLFIVGMPRSGTSLLEQILASHPQTFGAGELKFWGKAVGRFAQESHTAQYHEDMLRETAAACLAKLFQRAPTALRVVDKMPGNFHHLGFIHATFPQARILHATRNPVDTCLSIYFQDFTQSHDYANDLDDLACYYREYRRLMDHWRAVLPPEIFLEVPYEALIEDPEGWGKRIIDFIGLEWDESCLDFHQTQRRVGTSSNWQVRQPIYKTSKERWRNYAEWIAPLLPLQEFDDPARG